MENNGTFLELSADHMAAFVYAQVSFFVGCTTGVTVNPDIDTANPVDRASFDDLMLIIIEDPGVKPKELHDKWAVTTQKMVDDGALDENNLARLKPYMVPFSELPIIYQTKYRLQVQLTRTLIRYNRNGQRAQKRQRQRERKRERISPGGMGVRKRGVSGRPT